MKILSIAAFSLLFGSSSLILPPEYTPEEPARVSIWDGTITVSAHARAFAQGDIATVEIECNRAAARDMEARFGVYPVRLAEKRWGMRGVFPIATDAVTGKTAISVTYRNNGKTVVTHLPIVVQPREFKVSESSMDLGRFSNVNTGKKPDPELVKFIEECKDKKKKAFASQEADMLTADLAYPRDAHKITSSFWEKRSYRKYKKVRVKLKKKNRYRYVRKFIGTTQNIHRGVDLRGPAGTPVMAMANGKVVLADRLHYEGNMVVIDHGNRFFTYYMHMEKLHVKPGDIVKAGDRIGDVGSTGMSTGPHLHLSTVIDGVQIDPLSILSLRLRD